MSHLGGSNPFKRNKAVDQDDADKREYSFVTQLTYVEANKFFSWNNIL